MYSSDEEQSSVVESNEYSDSADEEQGGVADESFRADRSERVSGEPCVVRGGRLRQCGGGVSASGLPGRSLRFVAGEGWLRPFLSRGGVS